MTIIQQLMTQNSIASEDEMRVEPYRSAVALKSNSCEGGVRILSVSQRNAVVLQRCNCDDEMRSRRDGCADAPRSGRNADTTRSEQKM